LGTQVEKEVDCNWTKQEDCKLLNLVFVVVHYCFSFRAEETVFIIILNYNIFCY
jgi:hypothetical protein